MITRSTALLVLTLSLVACAGVLGFRQGPPRHPFAHRAHVLRGINCVECHGGASRADVDIPRWPQSSDCARCHTKAHDERPCLGCHSEEHVRQAVDLARSRLRFDHRKHMTSAHGDCVRCHVEVAEGSTEAVLPRMATCFSCHQHRDQWTLRDCDGCHVDLREERDAPEDHLVHDGDWVREHGTRAASERNLCATCHSERQCAGCHGEGTVPLLPATLTFDEVPLAGLHRAGFLARHSLEARADPGTCTTCHTESSCIECHTRTQVAPGSALRDPHTPGWLTPAGGEHGQQARLDPASCAGCHGGSGQQLCVGCHRVGGPGGNPHGPGFSSQKALHHDVPCILCHGTGP